ncbi:hypothetical protein DPMN_121062 [Dreissena polymorpha]|uniref:Uncharacterized protein n=1 Tax=Dreissena polymorpha TaxID=45954 RepID=A0A9D4GPT2_DREPO|nr:hypothetical protein DPMN_121062 [Dreissena polymorpha]
MYPSTVPFFVSEPYWRDRIFWHPSQVTKARTRAISRSWGAVSAMATPINVPFGLIGFVWLNYDVNTFLTCSMVKGYIALLLD